MLRFTIHLPNHTQNGGMLHTEKCLGQPELTHVSIRNSERILHSNDQAIYSNPSLPNETTGISSCTCTLDITISCNAVIMKHLYTIINAWLIFDRHQCKSFITALFTVTSFSTGAVALSVTLTFLLTLVVGVSIGVLIVLAVNKCRRSEKITLQTETEMRPPPVIYEEPAWCH